MSDKLSSPSTSSSTSYGPQTPRSTRGGNGDDPFLVIRRQPPSHVFSNESFEVEVGLDFPKASSPTAAIKNGDGEIQVVATLRHAKGGREVKESEANLISEPSMITIPTRGSASKRQCKIRFMVRMESIRRDQGAAFMIQLALREHVDQPIKCVSSVSTNAVHVVNYKTKITMEENWEHVWYKDEGGRDKCMEVYASIHDKNDQMRTGENIPLHLTLCYNTEDGQSVRVTNQEILRTLGSSKIQIDKSTGKARIRFRVEDVSKNHQGQDFKLEVGPEPKAKGFKDVAPGYTPNVSVRSKRNKRARNASSSGRLGSSDRRSSPVSGRARMMYDDPTGKREGAFDGADLGRLREAMKGVINWTDEVVNGLYPLQWQVVGYAQNPDGTPDYSRPYHNMPNPNACISHVLAMYTESTRENLRILLNAVEQASPSRPDEASPYGSMAHSLPREPEDQYGMMRGPVPVRGGQPPIPAPHAARLPGLHPSVASEAFRDKHVDVPIPYSVGHPPVGGMPPAHQPMPFMRQRGPPHPQGMQVDDPDAMQMHGAGVPPSLHPHARARPMDEKSPSMPVQRSTLHGGFDEGDSRESEVEYVLAKQYKALRTNERLGFPAYSANKEILGFYRESSTKVGVGQFIPISRHRNEFGPLEIMQATEILENSIEKKSEAVHRLKDWGSISNLIDHALVYDWSKDIANNPSASSNGD